MNLTIRLESIADYVAIHALTEAAFRTAPHSSHTEHHIVDALRERGELSMSLVAEDAGHLVGHVALSPVSVQDDSQGWFGLGPISVLPQQQGWRQGSAWLVF